jgi:CDP-diacylglycerol--glycerol-3-phosphate 3-phosphatidyltransferase
MLHKLTIIDQILAKTLLPIIPKWVTPNQITLLRIASIPFVGYFFWTEKYTIALPLFFLSAFSDAIDGSLARTRNIVSDFGKLFDPLADKLLIATAALIIIPRYLDWSIVLTIVIIDMILIGNSYARKRYYGTVIQAENSGKLKMIAQSFGVGALLMYAVTDIALFLTLGQYLLYGAIFFALVSLVVYRAV